MKNEYTMCENLECKLRSTLTNSTRIERRYWKTRLLRERDKRFGYNH